ncbi:NAD(P)-binding protein [Polychaeton citri CBS 116435]|uniref:NAD(P)-binding protein n=1 Tax=Polychaeton citri CBS 116435 TaxID=1314669 RepID=A0A9P4Q204_9PEZI|nr:NAD(P)-binding protein [Polychaeton citri CBS 116435]
MARIFITGSADGIGQAAARILADQGNSVFLHARNAERAVQAKQAVPNASGVLVGDLSSIAETKQLAEEANKSGPWDTVVHNAGIGYGTVSSSRSVDGIATLFAVNTLAPYILTSLMQKPSRLCFMSSGLHAGGDDSLEDVTWTSRPFSGFQAYGDSKLHNVMLAFAAARYFPNVEAAAMDPGWVRTKMGGSGAPAHASVPAEALAAWCVGKGNASGKSGVYFDSEKVAKPHVGANDVAKQEMLLRICEEISDVRFSK